MVSIKIERTDVQSLAYSLFSAAKATLESQISVCQSASQSFSHLDLLASYNHTYLDIFITQIYERSQSFLYIIRDL